MKSIGLNSPCCDGKVSSPLIIRGFSLVELMVALALSTFLIGGLILTYVSGRAAAADAEDLSRVQENMRFISDHLLRDIRNAGFRDQLTLTFAQYEDIGQAFAQINDDGSLTIRYAGFSHCAQSRQESDIDSDRELTVITNTYSASGGSLLCAGDGTGVSRTAPLVAGVDSVEFVLLRPPGADSPVDTSVCNFDTDDDLETACTGVQMIVTFNGVNGQRTAVFEAAFRNVLVDRIYGR